MIADIVIMSGGWLLNLMAFLMLLDDDTNMPRYKALLYAIVLGTTAIAFAYKGLLLSSMSYFIGCIIWVLLAVRRG